MEEQIKKEFEKYLPEKTISYCIDLWKQDNFIFKISEEKKSSRGFFKALKNGNQKICIEKNDSKEHFLFTLIHEMSHQKVYKLYGKDKNIKCHGKDKNIKCHGTIWKETFKKLLYPLINEEIFSKEILKLIRDEMKNQTEKNVSEGTKLSTLKEKEIFILKDVEYSKIKNKRTRCLINNNQNLFLVHLIFGFPCHVLKKFVFLHYI